MVVPILRNDGITFNIDVFGLGLLADTVERRFILFLLQRTCHVLKTLLEMFRDVWVLWQEQAKFQWSGYVD